VEKDMSMYRLNFLYMTTFFFAVYIVNYSMSPTSCPAAEGVEKDMSMAAKALLSPSMSRIQTRPGM
jgi:hypothetical protein